MIDIYTKGSYLRRSCNKDTENAKYQTVFNSSFLFINRGLFSKATKYNQDRVPLISHGGWL